MQHDDTAMRKSFITQLVEAEPEAHRERLSRNFAILTTPELAARAMKLGADVAQKRGRELKAISAARASSYTPGR